MRELIPLPTNGDPGWQGAIPSWESFHFHVFFFVVVPVLFIVYVDVIGVSAKERTKRNTGQDAI